MPNVPEGLHYYDVPFPDFDTTLTYVETVSDGTLYLSGRQLCEALGVSVSTQLAKLREDSQMVPFMRELRMSTPGGVQPTTCLRKKEAAWWIVHIDPKRVKASIRDRLEEFQRQILDAADRIVFGDRSPLTRTGRELLRPVRGELHFGCPRCGAPLCFTAEGSELHLRIDQV